MSHGSSNANGIAPEPLDVGVRHRVEDVVPARRPAHFVVLLKHDRVRVRDLEFPFLIPADAQRWRGVG